MTTSQASRIYGIPYNSLLMYVRGKYGKSLKLDKLKETTPAAKDNLNTIGNSRSTPKEKSAKSDSPMAKDHREKHHGNKKFKHHTKEKRSRHLSSGQGFVFNLFDPTNVVNPFSPFGRGDPISRFMMGSSPDTSGLPMKELLKQIQAHQTAYDHNKRMQELERQLGSDQAKLLMPLFEAAHTTAELNCNRGVSEPGSSRRDLPKHNPICKNGVEQVEESGSSRDCHEKKSKSDENENELPAGQKKSAAAGGSFDMLNK